MKTVIEGVISGSLPWGLVGTGATFALSAMLAGLPGLPFAVGVYLPLGSLTPIFLGGVLRRLIESRRSAAGGKVESDPGILAASGLIAGEGLAGVAVAFLVAAQTRWPETGWAHLLDRLHFAERDFAWVGGAPAVVAGALVVAAVAAFLHRAGSRAR
jgi:hypothetical protein